MLTGFKFIGEQIGLLEKDGEENRYIFGFEESYGFVAREQLIAVAVGNRDTNAVTVGVSRQQQVGLLLFRATVIWRAVTFAIRTLS